MVPCFHGSAVPSSKWQETELKVLMMAEEVVTWNMEYLTNVLYLDSG